uniref:Uncharacterized protein n=2 Tax=Meloidogyne incognita TaxID=6306 RepID=A0A914KID0_MELIC
MAQFKYYELYSLGCFTARTERFALSFAFGLLLINMFLFIISLSFDQFWSFGTPAFFHIFAALALFYSNLAGKPSYCLIYLVINGVTIIALAIFFCTVLLLDIRPQLFNGFIKKEEYPQFSSTLSYYNLTNSEIRQLELALLLLLCIHWMGQSLVWHYYCYSKHFKAEEFYHQRLPLPTAASCASQNRATSFPIVAPVKRLQVVHQQSK